MGVRGADAIWLTGSACFGLRCELWGILTRISNVRWWYGMACVGFQVPPGRLLMRIAVTGRRSKQTAHWVGVRLLENGKASGLRWRDYLVTVYRTGVFFL